MTVPQLVFNGLALVFALGFLFILLWQNVRNQITHAFGFFVVAFVFWNLGEFISEFESQYMVTSTGIWPIVIVELGYVTTLIGLAGLVSVLTAASQMILRMVGLMGIFTIVTQRLLLIVIDSSDQRLSDGFLSKTETTLFVLFCILGGISLYLLWTYRYKIESQLIITGICIIIGSLGMTFPRSLLSSALISSSLRSIGIIALGFGILQREIIKPFHDQENHVKSIQRVTLAISSQIALSTVLEEIARQALSWLRADGVIIFLRETNDYRRKSLRIATVHNMPEQLIGFEVAFGEGIAGTVALTERSILLDDYSSWRGGLDFPLAYEFLGSVISAPLIYANEAIGVLLVVAGRHGHRFQPRDSELLELLASQAAVALAHSRLFDQIIDAREQLESVLASTESPVIATDHNHRLIFANLAARTLLDLSGGEDLDVAVGESYFPPDWEKAIEQIAVAGSYTYEISIRGREYLCHLTSLGGLRQTGWVVILNDVTELKELDRIKSEMVRMVSHDLKNPLMGAMAFADLAREDIETGDLGEVSNAINVIAKQLNRMDRIIRGVLDIERMKMNHRALENVSVITVVESARDEMTQFAQEHDVTLDFIMEGNLPDFLGDADQFERALINLIENAIKFSPKEGKVTVSVYLNSDKDRLIFCIEDNGVGIPEMLQERVFDRFFRGQQPGIEHVSGSGLGLSLVRTIVEQHGGKIWLESKVNCGTRFFIELSVSQKANEE